MTRAALVAATSLTLACAQSDPADTDTDTGTDTGSGPGDDQPPSYTCEQVSQPCVDESACAPRDDDYQPRVNDSADDMWPACVSDGGMYTLVDSPPSSIGRVAAFETIADLLWRRDTVPGPRDFTDARVEYVIEEGLGSRVKRREDLHYPEIPPQDHNPMVDPDKQCSVQENVEKYPDRCAGPAQIDPLVDAAFVAGQDGTGDPAVHAARIEAALLWFLYISTYKEAGTCATHKAKDCDSAWAYYTGGHPIDGGVGMSAYVRAESPNAHERIFDGVLAVRCWRDLVGDGADFPKLDEVSPDDQTRFELAWDQLDHALHRGFSVIVRERLLTHIGRVQSGDATAGSWAFLQVAGPVLAREALARGPANASVLDALWAGDGSDEQALADGLGALDAIFPCP